MTLMARPLNHKSLSFEFDLQHSPQKVWRALTDPTLLAPARRRARTRAGHAVYVQDAADAGWDGVVSCRMLDVEAQRKLSYTWVVGDMETVVTFTLRPTASSTHLSLLHSGFKPHQKQNFGGARYGWKLMGGKLVDLLSRTP